MADSFDMQDWYDRYYQAIRTSKANARFCEATYGRDLGQHGFMDEAQLQQLISVLRLEPGELALDLGCGDGRIAELISDATGARVLGVDNSTKAIESATARTAPKRERLTFLKMEADHLDLSDASVDAAIAVDTLYFAPIDETVRELARVLRPTGRLASYYSWALPKDESQGPETLRPEHTPLAAALGAAGLDFEAWDYTRADLAHMRRRKAVLKDLAAEFAAEGNQFIFENRLGEADGISRAIEEGRYSRHLYLARPRR